MIFYLIIICLVLVAVPTGAIILVYRAKNKRKRMEWLANKKYSVLQILVPKNNENSVSFVQSSAFFNEEHPERVTVDKKEKKVKRGKKNEAK